EVSRMVVVGRPPISLPVSEAPAALLPLPLPSELPPRVAELDPLVLSVCPPVWATADPPTASPTAAAHPSRTRVRMTGHPPLVTDRHPGPFIRLYRTFR